MPVSIDLLIYRGQKKTSFLELEFKDSAMIDTLSIKKSLLSFQCGHLSFGTV